MLIHPFRFLLGVLFVKSIVVIGFILYGGIGLGPDEAQYWTWSQALDWGYYSKPPGIAWQIWLGTSLFGSTELGVRFFSVVFSFAQACAMYGLARQCDLSPKWACWAGLCMAFTPLGVLGSFLAITDDGFLLCWTICCAYVAGALRQHKEANPLVVGIFISFGALFKWPMYLFWLFFGWARYRYFSSQSVIKALAGIGISLAGLLPSFWWNLTHEWATFRHVSATVQGGHTAESQGGNLFAFIGSQTVLISPLLFVFFILAGWHWIKHYRQHSSTIQFCGTISFVTFAFFVLAACFQKIQGNWAIFIYPTAFILILHWMATLHLSLGWLKGGLGLAIGLIIVGLSLPAFSFIPYKMNPFKHNLGWTNLKQELTQLGYQAEHHFLVADKYQTTSLLSFYNEKQKRAYFFNIHGIRKNQFSYWPSLQEKEQNQTGYFVWIENTPYLNQQMEVKKRFYQEELEKYFERVELMPFVSLISQGEHIVKGALIFKCSNCLGTKPEEVNLY